MNELLAAVPPSEYRALARHLEPVDLPAGATLYRPGDRIRSAYFLESGVASLAAVTSAGNMIELAMVGREGMLGIPLILHGNRSPYLVLTQIAGRGLKIRAELLQAEFHRSRNLQRVLLRFVDSILGQLAQWAVCNRFHTTEERLSRWLLACRERARSDELALTQEVIAEMLGATRTAVTAAARGLQSSGCIRYSRGHITILEPDDLASAACECHAAAGEMQHTG